MSINRKKSVLTSLAILAGLICPVLLAQSLAASRASAQEPFGFSFAAPAGWRIDKYFAKYSYVLWPRTDNKNMGCPIALNTDDGSSLVDGQNSRIARLRFLLSGQSGPVIHRTKLRSRAGVRILKADAYYQANVLGSISTVHYVLYSFRVPKTAKICSLISCGSVMEERSFNQAFLEVAKSIALNKN